MHIHTRGRNEYSVYPDVSIRLRRRYWYAPILSQFSVHGVVPDFVLATIDGSPLMFIEVDLGKLDVAQYAKYSRISKTLAIVVQARG